MLSAKDSEADITFDPETSNPHFSFMEDDGKRHDVWFLDGVTAFNEIHAADAYRPAGYALWRLGSEDASVWSVLQRSYGAPPPEGQGELLHIGDEPAKGKRNFEVDGNTGLIVDENYKTVPTPFVIQRSGALPGKIALTFDDGPDPDWTPKILDLLKDEGVHASFFLSSARTPRHIRTWCSVSWPRATTSETTPSPIPISAISPRHWSPWKSTPRNGCSKPLPGDPCGCSGRPFSATPSRPLPTRLFLSS